MSCWCLLSIAYIMIMLYEFTKYQWDPMGRTTVEQLLFQYSDGAVSAKSIILRVPTSLKSNTRSAWPARVTSKICCMLC